MKHQRGFSLVELLIVIGIIAVLMSILLPVIAKVRSISNETKCRHNLQQLVTGMIAFADDHEDHTPGSCNDSWSGAQPIWHRDWLSSDGSWNTSPQGGQLFPYVGKSYDAYLCPEIQNGYNLGQNGFNSNGHFDYAIFIIFSGAAIHALPLTSTLNYPDGHTTNMPAPYIVEEDPDEINYGNLEGGHSNVDQISHVHRGGGNYACADGHVEWVIEPLQGAPGRPVGAWNWDFRTPSGNTVSGGPNNFYWNTWASQ